MNNGWKMMAGMALLLALVRPLWAQEKALTPSPSPPDISGRERGVPCGLDLTARFELLPYLRESICKMDSSYDRSGGNGDAGHFLRRDGDRAVLADIKGAGCIYRFWSANAAGTLRIYFDNEEKPRIECPMQDLFLGKYPPFVQPLVGHRSGGWYCYFPIPFAKACRVEVEKPGTMYYHVQYHLFPDGTPVKTFSRELTPLEQLETQVTADKWQRLGENPQSHFSTYGGTFLTSRETRPIAPGQTWIVFQTKGAGVVRALRLKMSPMDRATLRYVTLRAYWDDATTPAVESPVGDFFGLGFSGYRFRSMPLALTEDGYACYFPMPFAKSARIELTNEGKQPVDLATAQVEWEQLNKPLENVGTFHAKWHRETTAQGKHYTILETSGRGHYVGCHIEMQGDRGIHFLEGDEKIYVDGETSPSIYGTGTEDFFTGGWYFDEGPFNLAFHGCMVKEDRLSRVSAYRYQVNDCVPFTKSIKVEIEHGGVNDYPGADYSSVAYWYQVEPADNWSPLPPLSARRPASVKARDVVEAETLQPSGGVVVDDDNLPVELSGGKAVAASANALTLNLNIADEAYYTIALGVLKGSECGQAQVSVDGQPLGGLIDAYAPSPTLQRAAVGMMGPLTKGAHTLTFTLQGKNANSKGQNFVVDYVGLRKQLHPGALEGERMRIIAQTPGVDLGEQDLRGFGPRWSNDAHLWFRPKEAGAFFTLELPVKTAGKYRVAVYLTKAGDYGKVQVSIDGAKRSFDDIGAVFDGYHNGVVPSGKVDLGEVELTAGNHQLKFTVVGKNEKSTSYMVGVDAVVVEAVR